MPHNTRALVRFSCAVLAGVSLATLSTSQPQAQYKLTVNRERLLNAQNEPQNWLMMNGDYSSQRYSKLTQINRENVKNLRMVWALALGGMQDVGQNGPEAEVNPLIDNGFMYTSDGWGTRASTSGPATPACATRVIARRAAASRCGKTRSSPTCRTAA
jgi:alcohol dehydrogenase (cytochrome c)